MVQYLTVHCDSYLKILVVFLFFHKLFSTLNHLNLWNEFHTIYFTIFRALEYVQIIAFKYIAGFISPTWSFCYVPS